MFDDPAVCERVQASGRLRQAKVAELYGLDPQRGVFFCDNALAVKASIPRPAIQGDLSETENHAGQRYAPLMDIVI